MVFLNYSTMQMVAKIVYYGPGLCGKTTNLKEIYRKTSAKSRGEMVSLETETDRTLFFDLLPLDVGVIGGFKTKFQLYTVPGQVFYNSTRKLVLRGVDGIVFVADSQIPMMDANQDSYDNLQENLEELGLNLLDIPLVYQFNKRDLPNISSLAAMNQGLNPMDRPFLEACALQGKGVFETLKEISKQTLLKLRAKALGNEVQRKKEQVSLTVRDADKKRIKSAIEEEGQPGVFSLEEETVIKQGPASLRASSLRLEESDEVSDTLRVADHISGAETVADSLENKVPLSPVKPDEDNTLNDFDLELPEEDLDLAEEGLELAEEDTLNEVDSLVLDEFDDLDDDSLKDAVLHDPTEGPEYGLVFKTGDNDAGSENPKLKVQDDFAVEEEELSLDFPEPEVLPADLSPSRAEDDLDETEASEEDPSEVSFSELAQDSLPRPSAQARKGGSGSRKSKPEPKPAPKPAPAVSAAESTPPEPKPARKKNTNNPSLQELERMSSQIMTSRFTPKKASVDHLLNGLVDDRTPKKVKFERFKIKAPATFKKAQLNCILLDGQENVVHTKLVKVEPHPVGSGKYQIKVVLEIES